MKPDCGQNEHGAANGVCVDGGTEDDGDDEAADAGTDERRAVRKTALLHKVLIECTEYWRVH